MKPWLLIDTETTGTDPKVDRLVEVGAVLFDPELGIPVYAEAFLVEGESNAAEIVNRIPSSALHGGWCIDQAAADQRVYELAEQAEYILAHQASFDRSWFPDEISQRRWLCTMSDASWPRCHREEPGLTTLALSYDVGVARAHRAIEDVLTLAAVLTRVHEIEDGLGAWLERAIEPRIEYVADVLRGDDRPKESGFKWNRDASEWRKRVRESQAHGLEVTVDFPVARADEPVIELIGEQGYANNQAAKDAGFRWDGDRKLWVRSVRESLVGVVEGSLGFRTRRAA